MQQLSLRIAVPAPAPAIIVECIRVGQAVRVRLVSAPVDPRWHERWHEAAPQFVRFPRRLRKVGARYACGGLALVEGVPSDDPEEPGRRPYYVARAPFELLPPPAAGHRWEREEGRWCKWSDGRRRRLFACALCRAQKAQGTDDVLYRRVGLAIDEFQEPPCATGAGKARDAELLAPGEAPKGADVAGELARLVETTR